jgi:general secretion pathway protein M
MKELQEAIREWFYTLQPRERLYVLGGAAALLVMIGYFAVWAPLSNDVIRLREAVVTQQADLTWMQSASVQLQQLQQEQTASGHLRNQSLLSVVDQSINTAGLKGALQRMEPDGTKTVKLWLVKGSFDQLVTMLGQLEQEAGIGVKQLSLTPAAETGLVDARITLIRDNS